MRPRVPHWTTTRSRFCLRRCPRRAATTSAASIHDQADRDAIASRLMRYRDQNGQDWADIVDFPDDASGRAAAGGTRAGRDRRREPLTVGYFSGPRGSQG
jgi:hypothetical protein